MTRSSCLGSLNLFPLPIKKPAKIENLWRVSPANVRSRFLNGKSFQPTKTQGAAPRNPLFVVLLARNAIGIFEDVKMGPKDWQNAWQNG